MHLLTCRHFLLSSVCWSVLLWLPQPLAQAQIRESGCLSSRIIFVSPKSGGGGNEATLDETGHQRILDGAKFQVLNESGMPLRFTKMANGSQRLFDSALQDMEPKTPEQKLQFEHLADKDHPVCPNYYQQQLPTKSLFDAGGYAKSTYEFQEQAVFGGKTPPESAFTDTLVSTKDSPLFIGVFPTRVTGIQYTIVDSAKLEDDGDRYKYSTFIHGDDEDDTPDYFIAYKISLSETLTLKEVEAPEGYELSSDMPQLTSSAVVFGVVAIDGESAIAGAERDFLASCKSVYGDVLPVKLLDEDIRPDSDFLSMEDVAEGNLEVQQAVVQITDPVREGGTPPDDDPAIPKITTVATDADDGDHEALADDSVTIVDAVSYSGLTPGREYTLTGTLVDKETGRPIQVGGRDLSSTVSFTPDAPSGAASVAFEFDGTGLGGRAVVAFERLEQDGNEVATHIDIDDKEQTVELKAPEMPRTQPVAPSSAGGVTGGLPQTGETSALLPIALVGASLVCLAGTMTLSRRETLSHVHRNGEG